ncbi:YdeI/OmpD-associated family protein [Siphonobacter sp. SORGH_AS_0500]|uniref:YdeI/OmpD-associated family protein n=1 Tax=Siphonobacter sp. SORGH_AS_0500 TaxID=1864824 RepID=UPI0028616C0C|nr:YdeI/OmpD-associated family protein [Siphonobacter sp. SORGH_AS_0500]MDR6197635.1 uncharacterized protein YdeI (YjbR/CyaY-like superfamily) [Siphonobacter sp. SORGH_AS_0500]
MKEVETFYPRSREQWREWLSQHHASQQSVWMVCYKKKSGMPTVSWSDAVEEALCFGWIDSQRKSVDAETFIQFFCRRKPKSGWSKVNKENIKRLTEQGLMTPAGLACIEAAQKDGSWTMLDEVEAGIFPSDLTAALENHPLAQRFLESLSKSNKRAILLWLVMAKRKETRQSRIAEIITDAEQGRKPKPCVS